jgi:predicted cupin superfamily sugar epimerase
MHLLVFYEDIKGSPFVATTSPHFQLKNAPSYEWVVSFRNTFFKAILSINSNTTLVGQIVSPPLTL